MKEINCAGLLVVKNRKLLLAFSNNKQAYYLPGGKIDAGETAIEALIREVAEELAIAIPANDLRLYCHITAPAFGEVDAMMQQDCFLYDLDLSPQPSNEIRDVQYFDEAAYLLQEHIVPGVITAFEVLRKDGLVD